MAVTSINYDEGSKKLGYKSVEISYGSNLKDKKIFDSGDFVKDWYEMRKFMILELSNKDEHFMNSSTVDHFIMDGAEFDSAYLNTAKEPKLLYGDEEGIEFFVMKGTRPTWTELRELCGDKSKKK